MLKLPDRFGLDLADSLASYLEDPPHFLKRVRVAVADAIPQLDDLTLPIGKRLEDHVDPLLEHLLRGGSHGRIHIIILDEITEVGILAVADGPVQTDRMLGDVEHPSRLLDRHAHFRRDLVDGGLAAKVLVQKFRGAADAAHRLDHVDRDANRPCMVGDRSRDGLANPPGGVRAELVAPAVLVLVHGAHQTRVALLDQVQEAQPAVAVLLGDGDDQTQVGAGERPLGLLVLGEHPLHRPQFFLQLVGPFEDQLLQAGQFLAGGFDVIGGHDIVDTGRDHLLELAHLLADALELALHRLNAARPQAQLLQERRDLPAVPPKVFRIRIELRLVGAGADALEELLIDIKKLANGLEVRDDPLLDHALGRQRRGPGLDRPIERHGPLVDLLQQVDGVAGTVITLEHLASEDHPRNLDFPRQRNLALAGQ